MASATHDTSRINILVLGNCQAREMARCLQAFNQDIAANAVEIKLTGLPERFARAEPAIREILASYDYLFCQTPYAPLVKINFPDQSSKVHFFPPISFAAYHPDLTYIFLDSSKSFLHGPLGHYNSAIALWGYQQGLSVGHTLRYFEEPSYRHLGYFSFWNPSRDMLITDGKAAGFDLADRLMTWSRTGCFMHSTNHPFLAVIADIAKEMLAKIGLPALVRASTYLTDEHADGPVWPVYPEIAGRLGIAGDYQFKLSRASSPHERPITMINLEQFVARSFDAFRQHDIKDMHCDRMAWVEYMSLREQVNDPRGHESITRPSEQRASGEQTITPYTDLPPNQFWTTAVAEVAVSDIDPVTTAFEIDSTMKVATAGSCFAQHISRTLRRVGLNYFVTEPDDATVRGARRLNYGIYSARYGNVYTAAQLRQLFERAHDTFKPAEIIWQRLDERFVDPFRPRIEPDGFASPEAMIASRSAHLHAVRRMFAELDVFVFTLGLTEAWRARCDQAVFPLAPGVAGGSMDLEKYEFVNFNAQSVIADIASFLTQLRGVNSTARIILTVSPIPLAATYEKRHVLVSNTYSKSVLRVAAEEICGQFSNCSYFPSYEIIAGSHSRNIYYGKDLRSTTDEGVDHVMRLFLKHYSPQMLNSPVNEALAQELQTLSDVVCDEDAIERRYSAHKA